jgi:hypothetical protein
MSERSIIQIRAHFYPKGYVLTSGDDHEIVDYPKLVMPQKPLAAMLKEISEGDARRHGKDGDFYIGIQSGRKYYEVLEDFYYYEPGYVSGHSHDGGYVSGADYDIQCGGIEYVFEDLVAEIHKDFAPLFDEAKAQIEKSNKSFSALPPTLGEIVVQHPAVISFGSEFSYDGEYDCWTDYDGLLDMTKLEILARP